mmetsp:Transcript_29145/g.42996  ORF Transcript_29145/g.42996 Transcript_29145/m.42996 type:complete len:269 (+) Transcript_29145:320-1126(+)|eukprot:CAMPEP_0194215962 /NCGR_PEP_ID=MMETSP0156-20130528/18119_1 /TAXON_ID=33649 /ORGANISM="Thalassionema nitzschioides, Strain L26-B" /LENGTH=268 /DNA_ID=CAMNT_0038944615 /DNA_START=329 /DNA_END=1135 /DNA_ORIENTATION=-
MVPIVKSATKNDKYSYGQRIAKAKGIAGFFATIVLLSGSFFFSQHVEAHEKPSLQRNLELDPATVTFKEEVVLAKESAGVVTEGSLGGLPYLHCSSSSPSGSLVLLHGAKFKKEDWKTGDLLQSFCRDFNVVALDLEVREGHVQLQNALKEVEKQLSIPLPVSALVTPSASGFTVVDWLDDMQKFSQYIQRWIPVAPPSVLKVDTTDLSRLKSIPILAIYGSEDQMGKKVSKRLGEISGAQVVEIPGSHPCYLDSPEEFIRHVQAFLA